MFRSLFWLTAFVVFYRLAFISSDNGNYAGAIAATVCAMCAFAFAGKALSKLGKRQRMERARR